MAKGPINAFTDLPYEPTGINQSEVEGSFLNSLRELRVGAGNKGLYVGPEGLWLGAKRFASAPFRVDMSGNVYASSITLTGYIAVGGAAADVNAGATTINGGKLTTGTVTADFVVASISITSPTITGGSIAIGSGNSIFKADSNGIYLGHATFASAPFRVNMSGQVTASSLTLTNASVGTGSSWTGNQIAEAYIGNLSASKITSGDIAAARIQTNVLSALQATISNLSSINADIGTITAGTIKVSTRLNVQKSDTTAVGYIGSDPDALGLWGFIANKGYGLMCKYSASSYFRIFVDASGTDAIIDLPSPDKLKFQDNSGAAILRLYGNAGWGGSPGGLVDFFHPLRLYTYDYGGGTSGGPEAGSYAYEGMMYARLNYGGGSEDNLRVYIGGAWRSVTTS